MTRKTAIGLALAFGCGFLLAQLTGNRFDGLGKDDLRELNSTLERISQAVTRVPSSSVRCVAEVDGELVRGELRRALQSACDCKQVAAENKPSSEDAMKVASARSHEAMAALEKGHELISQAISKGTWGDEEARAFRNATLQLDKDGQVELLSELVPAINEGRIKVKTTRPPF